MTELCCVDDIDDSACTCLTCALECICPNPIVQLPTHVKSNVHMNSH